MSQKQIKEQNLTSDLKILIVGKSGTGKTSFVNKWIKNEFTASYKATIVSEFSSKLFLYEEKLYKINLWDIAGQDHFASITKTFAKGSHGAITLSDVMDPKSLNETTKWKKALDESELFPDGGKLPNILIQNKIDLIKGNEAKDMTSLREFSKQNKFDDCFKTSAKTGYNINESIEKLFHIIIRRLNAISSKEMDLNRNSVSIDPEKSSDKDKYRTKQTGCC